MLEFSFTAFLSLLVIIDPLGLAPVFIGVVGDRTVEDQRRTANKAVVVAGLILFGFGLVGQPLFRYLGVSLDALRIAGGVILFKVSFDMIFAHRERQTPEEEVESHVRPDVSVFPLAIPMIAGPGAFATLLVLVAQGEGRLEYHAVVFGALAIVLAMAWVFLRLAVPITKLLGQTGVNVITRVLGIILAALAVQLVADGVIGLWPT